VDAIARAKVAIKSRLVVRENFSEIMLFSLFSDSYSYKLMFTSSIQNGSF